MIFIGIVQVILSLVQTTIFLLILGMVSVALSKSNAEGK